jgi:hypothetical protein
MRRTALVTGASTWLTARGERIEVLVNKAGVYQAPRRAIWDVLLVQMRGTVCSVRP